MKARQHMPAVEGESGRRARQGLSRQHSNVVPHGWTVRTKPDDLPGLVQHPALSAALSRAFGARSSHCGYEGVVAVRPAVGSESIQNRAMGADAPTPIPIRGQAAQTRNRRPSSSMRLRTWTATFTSVIRHSSLRDAGVVAALRESPVAPVIHPSASRHGRACSWTACWGRSGARPGGCGPRQRMIPAHGASRPSPGAAGGTRMPCATWGAITPLKRWPTRMRRW